MMVDLPTYGPTNSVRLGTFLRSRPILLNHDGNKKLYNYQVRCVLSSSDIPFEKLRLDKQDLLFINNNNEVIPYWLEKCSSNEIVVWLKITLISPGEDVIFLYYGNERFSGLSNGLETFVFFEDFSGSGIDENKWQITGQVEVSNSECSLDEDDQIMSKSTFGPGHAVIAKAKADEQDTEFVSFRNDTSINAGGPKLQILNSDYEYPNDFDRFLIQTRIDGNHKTVQYVDNQLDFRNTYMSYEICWCQSHVKYLQNSNLMTIHESNIPTSELRVGALVWDSSQESTLTLDWILVRKYTPPEPIIKV